MTETMIAWLSARVPMAKTRSALALMAPAASSSTGSAGRDRAVSSGSGRSPHAYVAAASSWAATAMTNDPVLSGSDSQSATKTPGPNRLGPTTAPTVVDHTTMERSRPRVSGEAMSVAANRACSPTAAPTPSIAKPSRSSGKLVTPTATRVRVDPPAAMSAPVESEMRLPRASASRARGIAIAAAPSVLAVATAPAHASEPDTSVASTAPSDPVAPCPRPASTWPMTSVRTVRA